MTDEFNIDGFTGKIHVKVSDMTLEKMKVIASGYLRRAIIAEKKVEDMRMRCPHHTPECDETVMLHLEPYPGSYKC